MRHVRPLLALVVVMLASLCTRSGALAAGLETLIMPGKVTSAHAKLEEDCSQCHDRTDRSRQAALCMACHKEVAADVRGHTGFHGRLPGDRHARSARPATRSTSAARPTSSSSAGRSFDHSQTDFPLAGAHASAACDACHKAGRKFREAPSGCVDCHRADDPHGGKLGTNCGNCHEPATWATRSLRSRQDEVRAARRPSRRGLRRLPRSATATRERLPPARPATRRTTCTAAPAARTARAATRPSAWKTSKFDHAKEARFPLTGAHAQLDCQGCHKTPNLKDPLPRDCAGCHRADDAHATRFGAACEKCHGTSAWKPATLRSRARRPLRAARQPREARLRRLPHRRSSRSRSSAPTATPATAPATCTAASSAPTARAATASMAGGRTSIFDHDLTPIPAGRPARRGPLPRLPRVAVLQGRGHGTASAATSATIATRGRSARTARAATRRTAGGSGSSITAR